MQFGLDGICIGQAQQGRSRADRLRSDMEFGAGRLSVRPLVLSPPRRDHTPADEVFVGWASSSINIAGTFEAPSALPARIPMVNAPLHYGM